MNEYYGTEACLLKSLDRGEADRMLTFFTKDFGRVDALAKSIRLASSKLKGHALLFSRGRIIITPGREFWRLIDIEIFERCTDFPAGAAHFLLRLVPGREQNIRIWQALGGLTEDSLLRFKIRVLESLGMLPLGDDLLGYFPEESVAFIQGKSEEDELDLDGQRKIQYGIEKILAENHMV